MDNEENKNVDPIESTAETKVVEKNNRAFTFLMILLLIIVIIAAYWIYRGEYIEKDNKYVEYSDSEEKEPKESKDFFNTISDVVSSDFNIEGDDSDEDWYKEAEAYDAYAENFFTEYAKNIETLDFGKDQYDNLYLHVKNNNDETLTYVSASIILYNAQKKPIEIVSDYLSYMMPGKDYYMTFYRYNTYEEYTSYEIVYSSSYNSYDEEVIVEDMIDYAIVEDEDAIEITVQNNSNHTVDELVFQIIGFDENGKAIDISYEYYDTLKKNKSVTIDCFRPYVADEETGEMTYLKYEVRLVEAYYENSSLY